VRAGMGIMKWCFVRSQNVRTGGLRARGGPGHCRNVRAVCRCDPRIDADCTIAVPPVRHADGAGQASAIASLNSRH